MSLHIAELCITGRANAKPSKAALVGLAAFVDSPDSELRRKNSSAMITAFVEIKYVLFWSLLKMTYLPIMSSVAQYLDGQDQYRMQEVQST